MLIGRMVIGDALLNIVSVWWSSHVVGSGKYATWLVVVPSVIVVKRRAHFSRKKAREKNLDVVNVHVLCTSLLTTTSLFRSWRTAGQRVSVCRTRTSCSVIVLIILSRKCNAYSTYSYIVVCMFVFSYDVNHAFWQYLFVHVLSLVFIPCYVICIVREFRSVVLPSIPYWSLKLNLSHHPFISFTGVFFVICYHF